MALEIFKLVGSVFVDTEKADESLQKTDKKASNLHISKLYKISLKPLKNGWFEALIFYNSISCKVL